MRRLLIPALASAMCLSAAPSSAAPNEIEVRISHADLDLSNPAHFEEVRTRIADAAKRACEVRTSVTTSGRIVDKECVADVTEKALAQLESRRARQLAYNAR
ncbi:MULTISPECIES: UrcA family protein [Qipengyuania]|uniref:UrcA family protein n=1 Tax=Qipengyuania TaxID=1855416 RepID=UPI001C889DED|nr:UrcA family protein [Qipengyuania aestuarii]MBX7534683.1 UrcA family protein [Qipengyuania aestuarii]